MHRRGHILETPVSIGGKVKQIFIRNLGKVDEGGNIEPHGCDIGRDLAAVL
jgi:hypothetical protein